MKFNLLDESGNICATADSEAEAAIEILTYDSGRYDVRRDGPHVNGEWRLWTKPLNGDWGESVVTARADNAEQAKDLILSAVASLADSEWWGLEAHPIRETAERDL